MASRRPANAAVQLRAAWLIQGIMVASALGSVFIAPGHHPQSVNTFAVTQATSAAGYPAPTSTQLADAP